MTLCPTVLESSRDVPVLPDATPITEFGVSALVVSFVRTFPLIFDGLASSVIELVSLAAVGFVSVINIVSDDVAV